MSTFMVTSLPVSGDDYPSSPMSSISPPALLSHLEFNFIPLAPSLSLSEVAQSCPTLCNPMDWMEPTRLLRPWNFPGKSTGVGCHFLLQRILPTRELAPTCSKILPHKQLPFLRPPLQGVPPPSSPLTCSSLFHYYSKPTEEKNLI